MYRPSHAALTNYDIAGLHGFCKGVSAELGRMEAASYPPSRSTCNSYGAAADTAYVHSYFIAIHARADILGPF